MKKITLALFMVLCSAGFGDELALSDNIAKHEQDSQMVHEANLLQNTLPESCIVHKSAECIMSWCWNHPTDMEHCITECEYIARRYECADE